MINESKEGFLLGLVLSGGGARGAYQAGVIKAISEIAEKNQIKNPFQIYTGVSAGAINASFMACYAENFYTASEKLCELWSNIESEQVFYTDAVSLSRIGLNMVKDFSFGGFSSTGSQAGKALLDTTPLSELLKNNLPFSKIQSNIQSGYLKNVAITAVDYRNSAGVTFVEGDHHTPSWKRSRRFSELAHLSSEHVMASAAIPMLFPPVKVGERYFGDGCVRNVAPLSPAIHLGAKKLIVLGVRRPSGMAMVETTTPLKASPSVARVMNVILNAVLMDGVELDIERLNRINDFLSKVPAEHHGNLNFQAIEYLWIAPSVDIGAIAREKAMKLPRIVRYLLKGLGPLDDASEIISYLLFEPSFCTELIEHGYKDGMKQKEEIEKFLLSSVTATP